MDWAHYHAGVRYPVATELRGPFFTVPPTEIEPSYQELWNGFLTLFAEIAEVEGITAKQ